MTARARKKAKVAGSSKEQIASARFYWGQNASASVADKNFSAAYGAGFDAGYHAAACPILTPTKVGIRKLAERIAADLFTDGAGVRSKRLVMEYPTDRCGCGRTGLSEACATDRIDALLSPTRPRRGRKARAK